VKETNGKKIEIKNEKKQWTAPKLDRLGDVNQITLGNSDSNQEQGSVPK
jgi:hypothetical protein